MTGWQWAGVTALGAFAFAAILGAYLAGLRHGELDSDSYWQGFADGEEMQRRMDRIPSPN